MVKLVPKWERVPLRTASGSPYLAGFCVDRYEVAFTARDKELTTKALGHKEDSDLFFDFFVSW
jgi:hypothetical protein